MRSLINRPTLHAVAAFLSFLAALAAVSPNRGHATQMRLSDLAAVRGAQGGDNKCTATTASMICQAGDNNGNPTPCQSAQNQNQPACNGAGQCSACSLAGSAMGYCPQGQPLNAIGCNVQVTIPGGCGIVWNCNCFWTIGNPSFCSCWNKNGVPQNPNTPCNSSQAVGQQPCNP